MELGNLLFLKLNEPSFLSNESFLLSLNKLPFSLLFLLQALYISLLRDTLSFDIFTELFFFGSDRSSKFIDVTLQDLFFIHFSEFSSLLLVTYGLSRQSRVDTCHHVDVMR